MRDIRTSITIEAPPSAVWGVLADFAAYPEWNPFVRSISGTLLIDEQLEVALGASGKKAMTFTPVVTAAEPEGAMAWLGHLGMRGIFDGHHRIELTPTSEGTRVDHFEEFSGALVPVLLPMVRASTTRGFTEMNEALKKRAEAAHGRERS